MRKREPLRPLYRSKQLEKIQKLASADLKTKQEHLHKTQKGSKQKRKRAQEEEERPDLDQADELCKQTRVSTSTACVEELSKSVPASSLSDRNRDRDRDRDHDQDPINYWSQHGRWPTEYFEQSGDMSNILARKRLRTFLSRKNSNAGSIEPSSTTPSNEKQREVKSAPYKDPRYKVWLQTFGSFMEESETGITKKS